MNISSINKRISNSVKASAIKPFIADGETSLTIIKKNAQNNLSVLLKDAQGVIKETQSTTSKGAQFYGIPLNGYVFAPQTTLKQGNKKSITSKMLIGNNLEVKRNVVKDLDNGLLEIEHKLFDTTSGDNFMSLKKVVKEFEVKNGKFIKFLKNKIDFVSDATVYGGEVGFKAFEQFFKQHKAIKRVLK